MKQQQLDRLQDIIIANEKLTAGQYIEFGKTYNYFDLIIGNQDYINGYLDNIEYGNLLLNGNRMINSSNNEIKEHLGNWTFSLINNKICNVRGVD